MNDLVKFVGDIEVRDFDGEPMIKDLDLGARLGYSRPRDFRRMIQRNVKGDKLGSGLVRATVARIANGNEVVEYYLSEKAVYKACILADTDLAGEVQDLMIDVFHAWRKGDLQPVHKPYDSRSFRGRLDDPYNARYLDPYEPQPLALFLMYYLIERNHHAQIKIPDEMWRTNLDQSVAGTKAFKNTIKKYEVGPVGKCSFVCDGKYQRDVYAYDQVDKGVIYKGFDAYFSRPETIKYLKSKGVLQYDPKQLTLENIKSDKLKLLEKKK